MLPKRLEDPFSSLFNLISVLPLKLLTVLSPWRIKWPILCSILLEIDQIYHDSSVEDTPESIRQSQIRWIASIQL